jgi:hypothetical protein
MSEHDQSMTPAELWDQASKEAGERVDQLAGSVTQREWLLITKALDRSRQEIGSDTGLTLCSMAWVKEKRDHGGAKWDRFLDMTDEQLAVFHGYPAGERPGDDVPADQGDDLEQPTLQE